MNSAQLVDYLKAGFIDFNIEADERYVPKILTNDSNRQVKVLENLLYELEHCDDFFFSVAFVTKTGIALLRDTLQALNNKNIKGKILASQYQNFTEPNALRDLLKFPNIELKIITSNYNFHAKGYLFHKVNDKQEDNYTMIVGSSNLTQSALTFNREWNVQLTSMKNGSLILQMRDEINRAWEDATVVDEDWIKAYEKIYIGAKSERIKAKKGIDKVLNLYTINPNKMQVEALQSIEALRNEGKDKALLISATGTGKTYLSAFDVRVFNPKRFLFIVHRGMIARKSMESYRNIIDTKQHSTGILTGGTKDTNADYIFATVQTLAKDETLNQFAPDAFDYIVIDEAHHIGASLYTKILNHFKPKFLLGMTATPERTNGYNIFKDFDYNIAYEIRLNDALEENMLVPFHYHGISEITIDGELLSDKNSFNDLVCEERVKHILHYADFYGCDQGRVRGLVFCSKIEEAKKLAEEFTQRGKRSICMTGETSEVERQNIIHRLEIEDYDDAQAIDYVFSVDVLNEGVDIPSINQVIMLRPTESAIIFVQQLGRGLRKSKEKRYLEVIDFIGNYKNNYLLPIALYGDYSRNKERLRRIMHHNFLPGASTVYLEDVVKERIFKAIDTSNYSEMRALKEAYNLVKFKIGHAPMMQDFINLGDIDPYNFVKKSKSYFNFKQTVDHEQTTLSALQVKVLEFISLEIANGRRLEDIVLLKYLIDHGICSIDSFVDLMQQNYNVKTSIETVYGVINVLKMTFFKTADANKYGNIPLVMLNGQKITLGNQYMDLMKNDEFKNYVIDALDYGIHHFLSDYNPKAYYNGFKLYSSYTRKDACRILNWDKDESSTVYGYRVKTEYHSCPIFVTYKKSDNISDSTKYEDEFVNPSVFHWWTRSRLSIDSNEVIAIEKPELLKLLFIKKDDDQGSEFYFMGTLTHHQSIASTKLADGKKLSIVEMFYYMNQHVEPKIYSYFAEI